MPKDKKSKADNEKKNTSLRLEGKTLKALKIRAIEEETSVQKIIEMLVETYLGTPVGIRAGTKTPLDKPPETKT